VHVGFVVDKVTVRQVFFGALRFYPASYHSNSVSCLSISGAVTISPFEAAVPWDVLFVDM